MLKSFTDMDGWRVSSDLSRQVFELTQSLPRSEDYGLTSQVRRSVNSISSDLAEGFGRNTKKDKRNFYIIARGSAFETQSHLLYGVHVGYFESELIEELIEQYQDLIHQLNKILKSLG